MAQLQSASYPLGGTNTERDRLVAQAEQYAPSANWLLDQIGIAPGWRAADIGCGPIGILNLLSQRVGPDGTVVGLEREARFVEMARAETARRGLGNVTVVQGDALSTGLEKSSFDFVHERLVLINVSAREACLSEMLSLLRPGGAIALEDVDNVSWLCQPAHPSWDVLLNAFHTVFHAGGGDGFVGRRLPVLMRAAGVRDVQLRVTVATPPPGDYRRTHLIALIDSVREKIVAKGLLGEAELNTHRDAVIAHLSDPATTVIDKLFVQAWGRKPD
ncbi:MAG TPA: methyltransferase domain-containing protein [Pseudolabrys sp.]|nr:methyltransferase domain-containing protein [Pseudolabrys sp.]